MPLFARVRGNRGFEYRLRHNQQKAFDCQVLHFYIGPDLPQEDIWNVELTVRANGKGDIVFGRTERYGPNGTRQVSATCLLGIDDVQKVEQLLMEIPYDNAEPTNSR